MHAKANLARVSRIQELNRRMTHTSLELPLLCNTIGLNHPSLTLNNHLESLHEHVCAGPIAEVVSLVLVHVLHSDVALSPGDVTPVASPALPGAADKNNDDEGDGDIMIYLGSMLAQLSVTVSVQHCWLLLFLHTGTWVSEQGSRGRSRQFIQQ